MMKMVSILLFSLFWGMQAWAEQRECSVDLSKTEKIFCGECQGEINIMSKEQVRSMEKFTDAVTHETASYELYRKLLLTREFLENKKNRVECSNYNRIITDFSFYMQTALETCAEPPTAPLTNRNKLCGWTLYTHFHDLDAKWVVEWADWQSSDRNWRPKANALAIKQRIRNDVLKDLDWCQKINTNWSHSRLVNTYSISLACDNLKFNLEQERPNSTAAASMPQSVPPAENPVSKDPCSFYYDTDAGKKFYLDHCLN